MNRQRAQLWVWVLTLMSVVSIAAHFMVSTKKPGADPIFRCGGIAYLPWPFMGKIAVQELVAVTLLTLLSLIRSRIAVSVLLVLFLYTRLFIVLFVFGLKLPGTFVHLIWTICMIQGVRGVFALNRLNKSS